MTAALRGPGRYDPDPVQFKSDFQVGSTAFRQRSKRFSSYNTNTPGPPKYRINRSIVAKKPHLKSRPSSCFIGTVIHPTTPADLIPLNIKTENTKKKVREVHLKSKAQKKRGKRTGPGPGDYHAGHAKDMLDHQKPLTVEGTQPFQSEVRRFLNPDVRVSKGKDFPGPGTYEVRDGFDDEKMLISDPVFMSDCPRELFEGVGKVGDGLGVFSPKMEMGKKDFHVNQKNVFVV